MRVREWNRSGCFFFVHIIDCLGNLFLVLPASSEEPPGEEEQRKHGCTTHGTCIDLDNQRENVQ